MEADGAQAARRPRLGRARLPTPRRARFLKAGSRLGAVDPEVESAET